MTGWIRGLVWDSVTGFFASLGWPQVALLIGGALFVLLFISTVLGTLRKHAGTLMVAAVMMMLLGWYAWPAAPPPPPRVVQRLPARPLAVPQLKLPRIDLSGVRLPDLSGLADRLASALKPPEAKEHAPEADKPRPVDDRLAALRRRKAEQRRRWRLQNEQAAMMIDAYIAEGLREAEIAGVAQQQAMAEMANRFLHPPVLVPWPR